MKKPTVLITGASKGIGKGIAKVFNQKGYNLFLIAQNSTLGQSCKQQLIKQNKACTCTFFSADVSNLQKMQQGASKAAQIYGGIDVVCANAGIFPSCDLQNMTGQDFDKTMNVNMKGTLFTIQACLPFLKKSSCPRIVLISSITGPITGAPGWSHYGASKAAQLGFMRSACLQLAKYKITMNAVLPGNIQTEGLISMGEEYIEGTKKSIPLKTLGKPQDIGHAVAFFASKEAAFITGQTLVVDGGQVLPQSIDICDKI